jgi:Ribonuclease G/E
MICPTCGGTGRVNANELDIDKVERAIEMLSHDSRRDIYETTTPGTFGLSYLQRQNPLHLSQADCDELVKRGIVFQDPDCAGWYHQKGYRLKNRKPK